MARRKPRVGYRWAKFSDFYVTHRYEWNKVWYIVRISGRMGVWLGAYSSKRAAYRAIYTAVHQRSVDVPDGDLDHPLFVELPQSVPAVAGTLESPQVVHVRR
jgi:hypothetical protein